MALINKTRIMLWAKTALFCGIVFSFLGITTPQWIKSAQAQDCRSAVETLNKKIDLVIEAMEDDSSLLDDQFFKDLDKLNKDLAKSIQQTKLHSQEKLQQTKLHSQEKLQQTRLGAPKK